MSSLNIAKEESIASNGLLSEAQHAAARREAATTSETRKSIGQFFTPVVVAEFMSNMFTDIPVECRLLDAGAGVGTLTAAVCERISKIKKCSRLHADLYETDLASISQLRSVMEACKKKLLSRRHCFSYNIIEADFALEEITSSAPLFVSQDESLSYDLAIMNPPYFKINANSAYARYAIRLGASQPNIYSLFIAAAIERLRNNGELIAITPRSYCNGLYFRDFRRWLFHRAVLEHIHTFASRNDTFREAKVLQESIITRFRKSLKRSSKVIVTRSYGRNFSSIEKQSLQRQRIIDNSCNDNLICIPESIEDVAVLEIAEGWRRRFSDNGLKISTGPVVMFRTRQFHIESIESGNNAPLLTAHHVKRSGICWPKSKQKWPEAFSTSSEASKHLVPVDNYVLLRRFSAKEERRRLTASALFASDFSYKQLALENHINYVTHNHRSLSLDETVGIEALFNSALFDRYFRTISGNTQVNATEVRTMKFPDLATVATIGNTIRGEKMSLCKKREEVVYDVLNIHGKTREYLEGLSFEPN